MCVGNCFDVFLHSGAYRPLIEPVITLPENLLSELEDQVLAYLVQRLKASLCNFPQLIFPGASLTIVDTSMEGKYCALR